MRPNVIAACMVVILTMLCASAERAAADTSGGGGAGVQNYLNGLELLQTGEWADAIDRLNQAITAEPENADYYRARGVAETLAQKLTDAQRDLTRANRLDAKDRMTLCWLASTLAMQGQFTKGTEKFPFAGQDQYFNAVREMSHHYGQMAFAQMMGDQLGVQQARGERQQAIAQFKTLAKGFVERVKPAGGGLGGALKQRGIDRYNAGKFAEAYEDLYFAHQAEPGDLDVAYRLACCEMMTGRWEIARKRFTEILTAAPRYYYALIGRALVLARLGDKSGADGDYQQAKKMLPKVGTRYDKEYAGFLTDVTSHTADQRAAMLDDLYNAVRQGGQREALLKQAQQLIRACAYGRLRADERYERRLTALRAKAAAKGATADDWSALGEFLYTEAFRVVGEAVEPHAPSTPYRPQTDDSQKHELQMAIGALDEALKLNPDHARAIAFKAGCIFSLDKDWQTAEQMLKRALQIDSSDPDILEMMARVLDYAAFVQTTAAARLRQSTYAGEDDQYIYYRLPSAADLKRANELDAMARRLWAAMYKAMDAAIKAHPGSPESYYYQALVNERGTDYKTAAANLRYAVKLRPDFLDAWEHLWSDLRRTGERDEMYHAQLHAVNFVQTSAAPLLKEVWEELNRTAYSSCMKLLDEAAHYDAADPRVAAYRGCVLRAQGDAKAAAAWFVTASLLEQARMGYDGVDVTGKSDIELTAGQVGRVMAYDNAAAQMLNRFGKTDLAIALTNLNINLYHRVPTVQKYTMTSAALLPQVAEDPTRLPDMPTIEALVCWTAVIAGESNVLTGNFALAEQQYQWAAAFESRKPPTMDQGMAVRVPGKWATLGLVDCALRNSQPQLASQRMQMFGFPSFITPAMQAEADRLRNAIDKAGYRSGGDTAHDMMDRMRRRNQQNP